MNPTTLADLSRKADSLRVIADQTVTEYQAALLEHERAEHAYRQAHATAFLAATGTDKTRTATADKACNAEMLRRNEARAVSEVLKSAVMNWREQIRLLTSEFYATKSEQELTR